MMNDGISMMIIIGITIVAYYLGLRWWRYRRASKLADKLLDDVVKGKDAFRR